MVMGIVMCRFTQCKKKAHGQVQKTGSWAYEFFATVVNGPELRNSDPEFL
jgi:hypothetical protein